MNRSQFEHAIRAAAAVVGESEILVIGSQAIHASLHDQIPESAMRSVEADIALFADEDGAKSDLVDVRSEKRRCFIKHLASMPKESRSRAPSSQMGGKRDSFDISHRPLGK